MDGGVATINQSCGVESSPVVDPQFWTFQVAADATTEEISTKTTARTTARPPSSCSRRLSFDTVSNETTSVGQPLYIFCFSVSTSTADVTISANTWVPCSAWKASGAGDPLLELYSENNGRLLAQNDDGNSLALQNCFAAVLSYRLPKGDYRVVVRNPKCTHGTFELRLSAETTNRAK